MAPPKKPQQPTEPTWRIVAIAKKGRHLGIVRAPSAEAAIARAIETGLATPAQKSRLMAIPA